MYKDHLFERGRISQNSTSGRIQSKRNILCHAGSLFKMPVSINVEEVYSKYELEGKWTAFINI
jgi:hypothetical protein